MPVLERAEHIVQIGVIDGFTRMVRDKVLLGHIGHVKALLVLGQQVVIGLILERSAVFGDGIVPFVGIGEHGIHVKDHPAKRMFAMADDLSQMILCLLFQHDFGPFVSVYGISHARVHG